MWVADSDVSIVSWVPVSWAPGFRLPWLLTTYRLGGRTGLCQFVPIENSFQWSRTDNQRERLGARSGMWFANSGAVVQPESRGNKRLRVVGDGHSGPTYAVWEVTLRCNQACRFCGSRAGKARTDELTRDECLATVTQLAELGVREG